MGEKPAMEQMGRNETLGLPSSNEDALAPYGYVWGASAGQPCKVRKTGRLLSKRHESRRPRRVVSLFVSADSNRLSPEGIAAEMSVHYSHRSEERRVGKECRSR